MAKSFTSLLLFFLAVSSCQAAVIVFDWDGGSGNWGDSNWNGGMAGPGFDFGDLDPAPNPLIDDGSSVDASAMNLVVRNNGVDTTRITLDNGSTLTVGSLDLNGDLALLEILDGNLVVNTELRLDGPNGANAEVQFHSGLITLNASHSMKGNNNFFQDNHINFLGAAGAASVLSTAIDSNSARTLAGRVARGYFSIDSMVIDPMANETDLAALNAELLTLAVGGRYFQVTDSGTSQSLDLLMVPEPSVCAMLIATISLLFVKRQR